ncbi:MAG: hypothetical protein ACP5LW_04910 [Nitrososphaeria archaeon]
MKLLFVGIDDPSGLEGSIRTAHAFYYAVNLSKAGHEVRVYLDGPGVKIPVSESPYKGLRPAFENVLNSNLLLGACGYCASPPHLNLRDRLKGIKLIGDEEHHYAFEDLVADGYQIIIA